jgi:hypothetical protein
MIEFGDRSNIQGSWKGQLNGTRFEEDNKSRLSIYGPTVHSDTV